MDFKQIEAFINVAKFKSFSKAAEASFLSQPTISTHIGTLENELGVTLFDRAGKDIQLTPSGVLFYDYAINILNTRSQAVYSISEFYDKIEGELHIAASTTPCKCILPRTIKAFTGEYPMVSFRISETSSGEVISNILRFDAEIGIVGKMIADERLIYHELTEDRLVAITPVSGRFEKMESPYIEFKDIQSELFIQRESTSATRQEFELALASAGYSLNRVRTFCEVSSMDTAIEFVRWGLGVSIISENAALEYINSNAVKRFYIKDLSLNRKIYMVKLVKRTLSPAAKIFQSFALSFCECLSC